MRETDKNKFYLQGFFPLISLTTSVFSPAAPLFNVTLNPPPPPAGLGVKLKPPILCEMSAAAATPCRAAQDKRLIRDSACEGWRVGRTDGGSDLAGDLKRSSLPHWRCSWTLLEIIACSLLASWFLPPPSHM